MAGSLDGVALKMWRARDHYEGVAEIASTSPDAQRHRVVFKPHPDGLYYGLHVGPLEPVDSDAFAPLIGDFLFDVRSALDHLAYQLHVRRFNRRREPLLPPEVEQGSQFPIFQKPHTLHQFMTHPTNKNLSKKHRAKLERVQPYNAGKRYGNSRPRFGRLEWIREGLRMLDALHRIDKHRRLHLVWTVVQGVPVPKFPPETGFRLTVSEEHLEADAEVCAWSFEVAPDAEVLAEQMSVNNFVFVCEAIDETPELHGSIAPLLQAIYNRAMETIRLFESDFAPADLPPNIR